MLRRPPRSTRPHTLFPYTTLFRPLAGFAGGAAMRKRIRCSGSPATSPRWQGADPMSDLFRKKIIAVGADQPGEHRLARTLSWPHLVALGDRKSTRLNSSH